MGSAQPSSTHQATTDTKDTEQNNTQGPRQQGKQRGGWHNLETQQKAALNIYLKKQKQQVNMGTSTKKKNTTCTIMEYIQIE